MMTADTKMYQTEYTVRERTTPVVNTVLTRWDTVPDINAYVRTTAKRGAQVLLQSPKGDPLCAMWNYGKGKTLCLMTACNSEWAPEWTATAQGQQIIADMISSVLPQVYEKDTVSASITLGSPTCLLRLTDTESSVRRDYRAVVTAPDRQ